jgi:pSer/pThr/pTyr-binding forkhead associated (FHA) protein
MRIQIKIGNEVFSYEMTTEMITIGRSSECDFVIPREDLSRKHCQFTVKNQFAFIMDMGSKNGTMIDGKRLTPNEQFPVYPTSRVIIANLYELYLPNSTIKEDESLKLDLPKGRR